MKPNVPIKPPVKAPERRPPREPTPPPAARPSNPPEAPKKGPLVRDELYLVESDLDPSVLVGRFAGIRDGHVFWEDTNRERVFRVAEVTTPSGAIVVRTEEGPTYTFTPMTLAIYDEKVKARVELSPEFPSTEALRKFYLETSFG